MVVVVVVVLVMVGCCCGCRGVFQVNGCMAVSNVVDGRGDIDYYGEVGWHGEDRPIWRRA